jgi:hypothetical protein
MQSIKSSSKSSAQILLALVDVELRIMMACSGWILRERPLELKNIKDTGLHTIVIPSTSLYPTLLECKYEGYLNYSGSMFCSNITSAVAKYALRCILVQVKICSRGMACKIALSALLM